MTTVETVKRICMEEASRLTGAEVIAPLGVFGDNTGTIGVQIKAPKQMGPQACEVVGNFTLTSVELRKINSIRMKAACAVMCMLHEVQVQIRPLEKLSEALGKRHAD